MDCKKHVSSNSTFVKVNESSMYRDMGLAPAQTWDAAGVWGFEQGHPLGSLPSGHSGTEGEYGPATFRGFQYAHDILVHAKMVWSSKLFL